jgi:hypothetical protein
MSWTNSRFRQRIQPLHRRRLCYADPVATLDTSPERREPALPAPGLLVDHQIRELMSLGLLKITDFDPKRLASASYDFGVGPAAAVTTASRPVDLRKQPLVLEPNAAALVPVEEIIELSERVLRKARSA